MSHNIRVTHHMADYDPDPVDAVYVVDLTPPVAVVQMFETSLTLQSADPRHFRSIAAAFDSAADQLAARIHHLDAIPVDTDNPQETTDATS